MKLMSAFVLINEGNCDYEGQECLQTLRSSCLTHQPFIVDNKDFSKMYGGYIIGVGTKLSVSLSCKSQTNVYK